jgi:hypothetical protein
MQFIQHIIQSGNMMSIFYSDVIDSPAIDTHSPSLVFLWNKKHKNYTRSLFGSAVQPAFHQISIFFFAKIECGLYLLDRFDVLM